MRDAGGRPHAIVSRYIHPSRRSVPPPSPAWSWLNCLPQASRVLTSHAICYTERCTARLSFVVPDADPVAARAVRGTTDVSAVTATPGVSVLTEVTES